MKSLYSCLGTKEMSPVVSASGGREGGGVKTETTGFQRVQKTVIMIIGNHHHSQAESTSAKNCISSSSAMQMITPFN